MSRAHRLRASWSELRALAASVSCSFSADTCFAASSRACTGQPHMSMAALKKAATLGHGWQIVCPVPCAQLQTCRAAASQMRNCQTLTSLLRSPNIAILLNSEQNLCNAPPFQP